MKKISILGCGWLGLPLAKSLLEKGFLVNGSTTSLDKISVLQDAGINAFQITLPLSSRAQSRDFSNIENSEIDAFLENSEILIINIPPKLRSDYKENFVEKIQTLLPFIKKSSVKKVIFVSSISVYSDDASTALGKTETTITNPETESGKQLVEVENSLLENQSFETIILRFGGLIGEDRNPIKFLSGRKNVENPDAPINLIHMKDCIGIFEEILKKTEKDNLIWNQIYNAVYPFHPSRKEYYSQKANEQNLALPEFDTSKTSIGKIILSSKIENVLGYKYLYHI
ncbi:SDR family NAD(P)-dependent oxidoreductase [Flavobacterium sp.]|uniref:SDR family NAD(P)-dependent oxidoreductase n=1 Tax=Flavobacterium sp. TaxID=239 RepID=UPI00375344EC